MMHYIVIYDNEGTIISQYGATTELRKPVGVPYIYIEDYDKLQKDGYRPIVSVDVSVEPHAIIFGKTREEQEMEKVTLEEYQDMKQAENKAALAKFLKDHPLLWQDGEFYGVTQEDQTEMMADKTLYEFKQSIGESDWALEWHSVKRDCREFSLEEFGGLLNAIANFVYPFRQLEMIYKQQIYEAKSHDEVNQIQFIYMTDEEKAALENGKGGC